MLTDAARSGNSGFLIDGTMSSAVASVVWWRVDGNAWQPAATDGPSWAALWNPGTAEDGTTFTVEARTIDAAGRDATDFQRVTVDTVAPTGVAPQLTYTDNGGNARAVSPQTAVGLTAATLRLDWQPGSDGSGIAQYQVGRLQ